MYSIGFCTLCGHRIVQSLDHHLTKAQYPSFIVTPTNLIPACSDCNKIKSNSQPSTPDEEPLHPYFDDIESDRWLYARVIKGNPVTLNYYVGQPSHWDSVFANRVRNHFETFDLSRLYSIQAATKLVDIRHQLAKLHRSAGPYAVRKQLLDSAESCD